MTNLPNPIYILEGLPGSGKTSLAKSLSRDFFVVEEILDETNFQNYLPNQDFFIQNDMGKINRAISSGKTSIIDRGPLSTLIYNLTLQIINDLHDSKTVVSWYVQEIIPLFSSNPQIKHIILDSEVKHVFSRKDRALDQTDPWANENTLEASRRMYLAYAANHATSTLLVEAGLSLPEIEVKVRKYINDHN